MKKSALVLFLMPLLSFANQPKINKPLPLLGKNIPLSERDSEALKYSKLWLKGQRYPNLSGDEVVYLYGQGQPSLICAPLELCVISLEQDEKVVDNGIHIGDAVRWQIAPAIGADNKTQLVVKPINIGLETSLVIITDKRTYHIKLISRDKDYMSKIAFKYPSNMAKQWQDYYQKTQQLKANNSTIDGISLDELDFNYQIKGCNKCNFKPVRVYNDGKQTVIEMPKSLNRDSAPALLIKSKQGNELVNYRVVKGKYIVDRLFNSAILINGVGRHQEKITVNWLGTKQ